MQDSSAVYAIIAPILVFGPLVLFVFYNLVFKELGKIPEDIKRQREAQAAEEARFEEERQRKRGTGAISKSHGPNKTPVGFAMQAFMFSWFAVLIGYLSSFVPYEFTAPDTAMIKLSLSPAGQRKVECRKRSAKELAKLPPNMRKAQDCPRERWPVYVELELEGEKIYGESKKPAGLSSDGPSVFYHSFSVPVGTRKLHMKLRDKGEHGFTTEMVEDIQFTKGRVVAIKYSPQKGFVIN